MCGIVGIWHFNNQSLSQSKLRTFTDSLQHRGPDGSGYYTDPETPLGLGHRRLSILDLSDSGKQPMTYAQGRYQMTYNGEVFNFLELRQELESLGYQFVSETDTEVILAAYHQWGQDCLLKMNGMWGLAIWDTQKRELFLARDRFGIKPLYYLHIPQQIFAFASETIAFRHLEDHHLQTHPQHLQLNLQNIEALEGTGHTIYQNIFQLLPGHYLKISPNQEIQQKRWWNTQEHLPQIPTSYEQQVQQFTQIFQDACKIRMRSDVPLASALSGGLDSSSVYCTLHQLMQDQSLLSRVPDNWQKAYVATFPGTTQDETHFAKQVVAHIQGEAQYITPDYNQLVQKLLDSTLKFDNIAITPIFIVGDIYKHMAQDGIKVSMDGHGVDEMLLGYPHLVMSAYHHHYEQQNIEQALATIRIFTALHPEESQEKILQTYTERLQPQKNLGYYQKAVFRKLKSLFPQKNTATTAESQPTSWLSASPTATMLSSLSDSAPMHQNNSLNSIDKVLYENFHQTTLPMILRNFDRASMQHSIEIRMPFMDWRLISLVFALPFSSKLGQGFTKRILRDAMKGTLPETIRTRKLKIGLNAPMPEWFNGVLKELIMDKVRSQTFLQSNLWNGQEIAKFAEQKSQTSSWTWADCTRFWPFLNAYLLLEQ